MRQQKFYSKNEVIAIIDKKNNETNGNISKEIIKVGGFDCIWIFCKLERGWVASFEDCCYFCVKSIVESEGGIHDKKKFNQINNQDPEPIADTRKLVSALKKNRKKQKKRNYQESYKNELKISNKEFFAAIKKLKENGICTLRRTKKNLYRDLFGFIDIRNGFTLDVTYLYVPGVTHNAYYQIVESDDEILDYFNKENDNIKLTSLDNIIRIKNLEN